MHINRKAVAGTLQSNDCFVEIMPNDKLEINIKSIVFNEFSEEIEKVIRDTLKKLNVENCKLNIKDKAALDCTIKSRVESVIMKSQS